MDLMFYQVYYMTTRMLLDLIMYLPIGIMGIFLFEDINTIRFMMLSLLSFQLICVVDEMISKRFIRFAIILSIVHTFGFLRLRMYKIIVHTLIPISKMLSCGFMVQLCRDMKVHSWTKWIMKECEINDYDRAKLYFLHTLAENTDDATLILLEDLPAFKVARFIDDIWHCCYKKLEPYNDFIFITMSDRGLLSSLYLYTIKP